MLEISLKEQIFVSIRVFYLMAKPVSVCTYFLVCQDYITEATI